MAVGSPPVAGSGGFTIANLLERVVYRAVTIPVIEQTILI